ncbi:eukaryotic translation initiation factor eIF2A [Dictyocaulus viviparus]|uniref:Eukaryotic translation initiation factor 2A n=1 Tax=Dictyocaulus viviparus TaxID=29172 RepID=A0A0D8XWG1_DICVI|nr:eukaryotic translation initiation factor eIF2A [Dictyocaulus viviparus]
MGENLVYAVRGSRGLILRRGLGLDSTIIFDDCQTPKENPCSTFQFSNNGHIFAYCDERRTRAFEIASGKEILNVDLKRIKYIIFSPRDTHMITFEPYAIYGQKRLYYMLKISADQLPEPNMHVYNVADGRRVTAVVASKEKTWMPQFTDDESIAVRLVGSELLIHKGCQFEQYDRKLVVSNIQTFAVSPGEAPHYVACYTPAFGSSPGRVQVCDLNAPFTVVSAKHFFKTEKATLQWNSKGERGDRILSCFTTFVVPDIWCAVLVLSSTDVDATNQSYYGQQQIYLFNLITRESFMVHLQKAGPVHAAKWNPNGREFCVCYGFMPAVVCIVYQLISYRMIFHINIYFVQVSLFNLRGDETFHTNEGPRNDIFYNSFGNILLTCGFGNLGKGKMEFWDVDKKKQIVAIEVPNTILFEWAPDGQPFFTATTTPRLRIASGYRMWHYSGKLVDEVLYDSPYEELWEVKFRPMLSYNKFEVKELTNAELEAAGLLVRTKDASDPNHKQPVGVAKPLEAYVPPHLRRSQDPNSRSPVTNKPGTGIKMTETEKKIFVIKKKLRDVSLLKARLANGEELQTNQLEKIAKEPEFLAQLSALGGSV